MKKIVRNDLWMMIVAWCLILNNYQILAMVVGILASVYLFFNIRYIRGFRVLAVFLSCYTLSYLLAFLTVISKFSLFPYFCFVVSLNVALLNERLYKERLLALYPVFVVMFTSLVIFSLVTYFIPTNLVLANGKANIYGLIILIFIPYTFEMLISLIVKENNLRKFLNKQKYGRTPKMNS